MSVKQVRTLTGLNNELLLSIIGGTLWLIGLLLAYPLHSPTSALVLFISACIISGYHTFINSWSSIRQGHVEIDFLMSLAAVGAGILGRWEEASLLLFLFSLGHGLETYAMNKVRKSIKSLSELTPQTASVKHQNGTTEMPIENVDIDTIIVVKPHEKIPLDGIVVSGQGAVNEAPITGESMPIDKYPVMDHAKRSFENVLPANRVFAGSINGNTVLEIKVLKHLKDSTLAKMIQLIRDSEHQKSPTQLFTDNLEKYYVPIVLIAVALLNFVFLVSNETFEQSFYRAMAVLVAASPCALAISTPSAVLAAIARAGRKGVLIKGGGPLESIGKIRSIAFDKTGTLTEGKPQLTAVVPFGSISRIELLKVAVAVEKLSNHPIANAVVNGALVELSEKSIPQARNLESLTARGMKAMVNEETVYIGNRRLMNEVSTRPIPDVLEQKMTNLENQGHTCSMVLKDNQYLGLISVMDVPRTEVIQTIQQIKNMQIPRLVMLTGDNQKVANAIGMQVGLTEVYGNLLPEQKVAYVKLLQEEEGSVAMIGDGVNDAPALALSNVGISMAAAGSDVALETADISLMADRLENLPFLIALGRKANRIIKQNLFISLGMIAILVPATLSNSLELNLAVIAHEGSTITVVFNALRLLAFKSTGPIYKTMQV